MNKQKVVIALGRRYMDCVREAEVDDLDDQSLKEAISTFLKQPEVEKMTHKATQVLVWSDPEGSFDDNLVAVYDLYNHKITWL